MVTFIPTFSHTFEISHLYYLGMLPFINVPKFSNSYSHYIIKLHMPTIKFPRFTSNGIKDIWFPNFCKDIDFIDNYVMPSVLEKNGTLTLSKFTKNFTGIILTQTNENKQLISKFISPGNEVLFKMYQNQIPPSLNEILENNKYVEKITEWSSLPQIQNEMGKIENTCPVFVFCDVPFELPDNVIYAGENSYGYDCDGITMPSKNIAMYNCTENYFKWSENY